MSLSFKIFIYETQFWYGYTSITATHKIDLFYLFLQKLPLFPKYFVLLQRYLPIMVLIP